MKKTVVIIEDDEHIAQAEKVILEEDFIIHMVHDGEEGLEKVKSMKPDAVVLDVMLPNMSGFEICRAIKQDDALKATKVVMVTAKNEDRDENQGLDLGADDYIMKPFEAEELRHVIHQVLE